jgi:two-component system, chemotaxis family, chemotaxis protein CheY
VGFLVIESALPVRESLCYVLLSFGIKGIPVENRAAAMALLSKGEPVEGAIVDIDNKDVDGVAFVTEVKTAERTRGMTVIVHTVQTSKETVMRMVELGVAGYLLKPFNPESSHAKLAAIFSKLASHNSQRKHIRVKPDADELARVSFRAGSGSPLYSGRIVDISLGGLAMELFNPPTGEAFQAGSQLTRMEVVIGSRELTPSASVVMYKSKVLAVRFEILGPADKAALERYIFKSISS